MMRKNYGLKVLIYVLLGAMALQNVSGQKSIAKFRKIQELGGIEEYLYQPNGLQILLLEDKAAPVVTVQIVYRVGSKNEVTGNTGSTHLLEHLNFKGTPTFNKEKGTAIFTVLQGIGAQMNATTWNDRTNYYQTIPNDKIELALHIEADRMRNSLLLKEDKDAEMTVVRNEFERGENSPGSLLNKEIWATAYMAHPYHHSTIGWRSDIENMPIGVLRDFYNTYYWPDNATLTIVGDFEKDQLFNLVDKYFGSISKAPHAIPKPYTREPEQLGPRRIIIKKPGQQAMVSVAYKIPGSRHEDLPALEVLSQILGNGTSSLISKNFIDKGLATYGFASARSFQDAGLLSLNLGFSPDKNIEDLNRQLLELVEKVKNEGVEQSDVDRIVAKLNAQIVLSRDGSGRISGQLTEAIAGGDWTDYVNDGERLAKVQAKDVQRAAVKYLVENQSTTGYFIPEESEGDTTGPSGPSPMVEIEEKFYFRNPNMGKSGTVTKASPNPDSFKRIAATNEILKPINEKKYIQNKVAGIDVVTVKTGTKGFVTVAASFPISGYFGSGSEMVPGLTTGMLSRGTELNDKFALSETLDKLGTNIRIYDDVNHVNISFKCLSKDVDKVITLLAEELRLPLFDAKEFDLLKEQTINGMKRGLIDPGTQGSIALAQALYPKGHPNYQLDIEEAIEEVRAVTLEDVKQFHKEFFGTAGMHLVAVGDVDTDELYSALRKSFSGWDKGLTRRGKFPEPSISKATTRVVTIPRKPSAELFIGNYTGIERNDKDYLPFYMGMSILGGDFSGRLMQTVRDRDGLTYGISARHAGHNQAGGYWSINASFNPELFQKGLDATMVELKEWAEKGVTIDELEYRKNNIAGSYKVGLATTSGLAGTLLGFLERGLSPDYLEQFPKDVEAVSLTEVNDAIKKYIDVDKLVIIKSGSLNQQGKPLE